MANDFVDLDQPFNRVICAPIMPQFDNELCLTRYCSTLFSMKLSTTPKVLPKVFPKVLLLLSLLTSASSFAFHPVSPKVSPFSLSSAVYSSSDSSAPDPIYAKVGFSEDAMAKGLDPKMVLDKLGTRDDLVAKFLKDNKKFDQERAEEEVRKGRRAEHTR